METNIREETNWKKSCQWCKYFTSYQNEYEDELEPPDLGRCGNNANKDKDKCFGYNLTCDLFERAGSNETNLNLITQSNEKDNEK